MSDDIKNSHEMATEGSLKISESCNDVKNTHEVVIEEGLNISEPYPCFQVLFDFLA